MGNSGVLAGVWGRDGGGVDRRGVDGSLVLAGGLLGLRGLGGLDDNSGVRGDLSLISFSLRHGESQSLRSEWWPQ